MRFEYTFVFKLNYDIFIKFYFIFIILHNLKLFFCEVVNTKEQDSILPYTFTLFDKDSYSPGIGLLLIYLSY